MKAIRRNNRSKPKDPKQTGRRLKTALHLLHDCLQGRAICMELSAGILEQSVSARASWDFPGRPAQRC